MPEVIRLYPEILSEPPKVVGQAERFSSRLQEMLTPKRVLQSFANYAIARRIVTAYEIRGMKGVVAGVLIATSLKALEDTVHSLASRSARASAQIYRELNHR